MEPHSPRKKKRRSPPPSPDGELNPYLASAADLAPRRHANRASVGAVMVFLAAVVAPLLAVAIVATNLGARATRFEAWIAVSGVLQGTRGWIGIPFGVLLVVGAFRLTEGPRGEPVSSELRAATRVSAIAHAVTLALLVLTMLLRNGGASVFFEGGTILTRDVTEALLALTAARYLPGEGAGAAARAGRWLALALLAAIVAEYVLTRETHDDLFRPLPPQYAFLVLPIDAALWIGKLAVFGRLCWVLVKRAGAPAPRAT